VGPPQRGARAAVMGIAGSHPRAAAPDDATVP